jgi:hypothetical protein
MEDWQTMVEDCEKRESKLTAWEAEFIASLRGRLDAEMGLTDKQAAQLEKVWERVT